MKQDFYVCKHCGNIIAFVNNTGTAVTCCNEKMVRIVPCSTEASTEKHIPVIKQDGDKIIIEVGSAEHPMSEEHYIQWVSIQTEQGNQRKVLSPNQKPVVEFKITEGDVLQAAFAYCNLHGLWKAEV